MSIKAPSTQLKTKDEKKIIITAAKCCVLTVSTGRVPSGSKLHQRQFCNLFERRVYRRHSSNWVFPTTTRLMILFKNILLLFISSFTC
jgi:hypothetical protein